jgi:multicomponent Na+:H+ antiporter subunit G
VIADAVTVPLALVGAGFFTAGALGVLRFPELHSRLHALTKADNLGMGFLVAALAIQVGSLSVAIKLGLLWVVVLAASSSATYLLARSSVEPTGRGVESDGPGSPR